MADGDVRFMKAEEGEPNLADDPRFALFATCVLSQHAAGFKDSDGTEVVDARQISCPTCEAPGFNTGWGYWVCICGTELMPDGSMSEPCGTQQENIEAP